MMSRKVSIATVLIAVSMSGPALAQSEFAGLFGQRFGEQQVRVEYESRGYFAADVADQRDEVCMTRHDFGLRVPVWQNATDEVIFHTNFEALHLDTNAWIPWTGDRLPSDLWNVRIGGTYRHRFDNDWQAGVTLNFGSRSDRLFASGAEMTLDATGMLRIPHGETNAWVLLLNYSNHRSFWRNVPLPGFGYEFAPSPQLRGLVGAPFNMVQWMPLEKLTVEASYLIPRTIHAKVGYRIVEPVEIYAGFDWDNDRWFRSARADDEDQLFYYEKRVTGGVRWDFIENAWLDFSAGYAFDRFFFEGEDYDDRHDHRIDIDGGPLLMLQLGMRI